MTTPHTHILIVAGEASGDHHAARLVEAVHRHKPDIHFSGIGGERMRAAGVEILVDSATIAVVGLIEVLAHYPDLKAALERMRAELHERRPQLLILVDYPDFNLRLAKSARQLGIKVLYYISPQIWAWRQKRVFQIKKRVNTMAVIFPFEVPIYESAGVPVKFVGHPLVDEAASSLSRDEALRELHLDPTRPVLGLFPGSRRSEIKRLLPVLLKSAALIRQQLPEIQLLLPRASTVNAEFIAPYLAQSDLDIRVIGGRAYDVMRGCDTIITASGTATLEIALMQVPLIVIYKIAPLSYAIMSRLIKVDHIALCNIVAEKRIAPELIQNDATPTKISTAALTLLQDETKRAMMCTQLATVRTRLGDSGASERVAQLTLKLLDQERN